MISATGANILALFNQPPKSMFNSVLGAIELGGEEVPWGHLLELFLYPDFSYHSFGKACLYI